MKTFIITGSMVAAVLVLAVSKSSAQIAAWDVSGSGSPAVATLTATTSDPNLSAAPVLGRVDVGMTAAANSFNSSNWDITATLATNDNYITFSVSAAAGYQLNMTSLSYAMNGSNTAPGTDQWGF